MKTHSPNIHLITGYLGSGKTQFLSSLLERNLLEENVAVIVNDFGQVMFDGIKLTAHQASRQASGQASGQDSVPRVEILDVPGGCLCCSAIEDFQIALKQVIERGAARIFIEATGLADAAQVQRDLAFMRFPVDSTLCVVDALNLRRFQTLFQIVNTQIQAADFLLISKIDLVKNLDSVGTLEQNIRSLNSRAPITHLQKGRADVDFLLQAFARQDRFVPDSAEFPQEHLLQESVTAFRVRLPKGVDFPAFERCLGELPHNIVRLKGLVRFDDSPQAVLVNYVAGAWNYQPLEEHIAIPSELFAIGQNVRLEEMKTRFDKFGAVVEGGTVRSLGFLEQYTHEHHAHEHHAHEHHAHEH